jgi:Skp family chaperone for outer membrane proteins
MIVCITFQMRYEERVQALEVANLQLQRTVDELTFSSHPHTNHTAIQRELDSVRERHKKQVAEMEQTISALRQEMQLLRAHKDPC